jgi:hypothetical protein
VAEIACIVACVATFITLVCLCMEPMFETLETPLRWWENSWEHYLETLRLELLIEKKRDTRVQSVPQLTGLRTEETGDEPRGD